MPSNKIFRKVSLERLSSPDKLDQLIHIISPKLWLSICALGILSLVGLTWISIGSVPMVGQYKDAALCGPNSDQVKQFVPMGTYKRAETLIPKGTPCEPIIDSERKQLLDLFILRLAQYTVN